MDITRWRGGR